MGERRDHLVMGVDWKAVFGASIERLLDSSPVFSSSIRQAFQEYQQPASEASPPRLWRPKQQGSKPPSPLDSVELTSASSSSSITTIPILPPISLLLALKLVLQASVLSFFTLSCFLFFLHQFYIYYVCLSLV